MLQSLKKSIPIGKSLYESRLKQFLPLYDSERNIVSIPDTLINHYIKGQLGEIKELKSVYISSEKGYCLISFSKKRLLHNLNIELNMVAESFNINKAEANIIFKCNEITKIKGKNWAGKVSVLIAKMLLHFLVIKKPSEIKVNLSDVSVDINWPVIKVDLSKYELYAGLTQKRISGLNVFDFISFKDLFFEPGKCNIGVCLFR